MAKRTDPAEKLVMACLELAAEDGWAQVTPAAVAGRARVSLAETYDIARDRMALLDLVIGSVDRRVLERAGLDMDDPVRDRLFDILMARFDVLNEHREAFLSIIGAMPASPVSALRSIPRLETSMRWMLDTAGVKAGGVSGGATVRGLSLLWLAVLRVWATDDSEDMARTMAALDQRLNQAEQWASSVTPKLEMVDNFLSRLGRAKSSKPDGHGPSASGQSGSQPGAQSGPVMANEAD